MPTKFGFGVIGSGMIADYHAQAVLQMPNAKLIGICSRTQAKAEALAQKHSCKCYPDINALLKDPAVDVVSIANASGVHLESAVAAAQAGKHAIIEKPIEITLERIDRIIEAHEKAGTTVGGIFNYRYMPTARMFKKAIDAGRFGRLTFGMAYGPWWRAQDYYDKGGWKGTQALDGGGALMNQGIHSIDLLQWLMGPVKQVSAFTKVLAHERIEVEDTGAAALEFANGALGTIACTTSMWPGHFRIVEIAGNRGTVAMADENFFFWQFADETPEDEIVRSEYVKFPAVSVGAANPAAGLTADGHRANFADFLDAIEHHRPPPISGQQARQAVEVILAIYESARIGKPVAL
jgi:UDP-N-acetyl-2-amino-2-deoxyglucuronate dehydrogenase